MNCADLKEGMIKCPIVDCNERTGRFLFQIFDFELHKDDIGWHRYLAQLSPEEAERKRKARYKLYEKDR